MKIALINENSQCSKNEVIYNSLKKVAEKYGHEVLNFGTYGPEDETQLTYVEAGPLTAILLNSNVLLDVGSLSLIYFQMSCSEVMGTN